MISEKTRQKVVEALAQETKPISIWKIREKTGANWVSIKAVLEELVSKGKVFEIKTSAGSFYIKESPYKPSYSQGGAEENPTAHPHKEVETE